MVIYWVQLLLNIQIVVETKTIMCQ